MTSIKNSVSINIPLVEDTADYDIVNAQILENRSIKGVFIRKAGGKNITGKALCNATALSSGFLTLLKGSKEALRNHPLQHLNFDSSKDAIGDYCPLDLPNGIDVGTSKVYFSSSSDIVTGEVLELVFIVDPIGSC